jgi:S-DNA-T family DNA segregation ATPase FtsK/SpoIIIE
MLFIPPGTSRAERIHGPYISEKEVKRVVTFLKQQQKPEYDDAYLNQKQTSEVLDDDEDFDEKYSEAVELVKRTGQASISFVQRRHRVGYNRAARMIELMEKEGIVGPADGIKPRKVFGREDFPS